METLKRAELRTIPKAYKLTMKKYLKDTGTYWGEQHQEATRTNLIRLGFNVDRDYMIFKNNCLCPVHII